MKNKPRPTALTTFPLTIGTPYGEIRLELRECLECRSEAHFAFRIVSAAPLLSTRAAEPFLYRLMGSLEEIGSHLWLNLPPDSVQQAIESGIYKPSKLRIPVSEA
jgi:hypothetical protein